MILSKCSRIMKQKSSPVSHKIGLESIIMPFTMYFSRSPWHDFVEDILSTPELSFIPPVGLMNQSSAFVPLFGPGGMYCTKWTD
jgi:hypothetical protein